MHNMRGGFPMEMHQVRYFLALCEELNFTRAAARVNVSQPSLTRAIKMLEAELGGPLFRRERQHTHLSELGRTVRPYLEQMYRRAEDAKREAQEFVRLQRTPLRLGLMCTIAPGCLVELMSAIRTRHPGVELHILDAVATALQERLIAGDLDVAIYALPDLSTERRLHYLPLYREQFMIVIALDHRLSSKAPYASVILTASIICSASTANTTEPQTRSSTSSMWTHRPYTRASATTGS
jgi:LysR family hydrogen peroxide-inducible transcriptional activator